MFMFYTCNVSKLLWDPSLDRQSPKSKKKKTTDSNNKKGNNVQRYTTTNFQVLKSVGNKQRVDVVYFSEMTWPRNCVGPLRRPIDYDQKWSVQEKSKNPCTSRPQQMSRDAGLAFSAVWQQDLYYRKRGSASYVVREVRSVCVCVCVCERERERERYRDRRKWRHLSSAEIGEEFCTFPCQKFAPWFLPSQIALSSHFSVAQTFALFETVRFLRKIRTLRDRFISVKWRDRGSGSTETNDRVSGCTVLRLIEKMNQVNTKN